MKKLIEIEQSLRSVESENEMRARAVIETAYILLKARLEKMTALKEYIGKLEASTDLGMGDEFPYGWTRFDASQFIDVESSLQCELLGRYLADEHGITVDYENDALMYCLGPCILVNSDDGDIYDQDSGKLIIEASEYTDEDGGRNNKKRNLLIHVWMESNGYFPSVVKVDRHGNAFMLDVEEV